MIFLKKSKKKYLFSFNFSEGFYLNYVRKLKEKILNLIKKEDKIF